MSTLCILIFLASESSAQDHNVTVHGIIKNLSNQVQLEDMSEMHSLQLQNSDRAFIPDSSGKFFVKFTLKKSGYFRLGYNILYLSPNDDITVSINFKSDPATSTFIGSHREENEYFRNTPFPHGGSFLNSWMNLKPTIKKSIDTIFKIARHRQDVMNGYRHLSPEFISLERNRIKADIINSLIMLPGYFMRKQKV